jgi:hypothetical protein
MARPLVLTQTYAMSRAKTRFLTIVEKISLTLEIPNASVLPLTTCIALHAIVLWSQD